MILQILGSRKPTVNSARSGFGEDRVGYRNVSVGFQPSQIHIAEIPWVSDYFKCLVFGFSSTRELSMQNPVPPIPPSDDEISLVDLARILVKRSKLIAAVTIFVTVSSVTIALLLPNQYSSTATLLPIEKKSSGNLSSLMDSVGGGLGMIAAQAGIGGGAADKFVTILNSRSLTEKVIESENLLPVLFEKEWDFSTKRWKKPLLHYTAKRSGPSLQDGVARMKERLSAGKDKKTDVISVSFTAEDPKFAARIVNAYAANLELYLKENALSSAKRNRIFIEGQLQKVRGEMEFYETNLKNFQQANKVVAIDAQTEASVRTYADLKSKVISAEVELRILEQGSFETDPRVSLKRQEISELKRQLAKFEVGGESGPIVSFQKAPSLGLNYARLKRELLIRERVFELLTQQFEMAKITEAQDDISFQVLDAAIPPEKKSGPKRSFIVIGALLASLASAIVLAFLAEALQTHREKILSGLSNSVPHPIEPHA